MIAENCPRNYPGRSAVQSLVQPWTLAPGSAHPWARTRNEFVMGAEGVALSKANKTATGRLPFVDPQFRTYKPREPFHSRAEFPEKFANGGMTNRIMVSAAAGGRARGWNKNGMALAAPGRMVGRAPERPAGPRAGRAQPHSARANVGPENFAQPSPGPRFAHGPSSPSKT